MAQHRPTTDQNKWKRSHEVATSRAASTWPNRLILSSLSVEDENQNGTKQVLNVGLALSGDFQERAGELSGQGLASFGGDLAHHDQVGLISHQDHRDLR